MSLNETVSTEISSKQESNETANYFLLTNTKLKKNDSQDIISPADSVFRNPNSIESFTAPSPAGSLIEQFDNNTPASTPLSVEDSSDANNQESNSSSQNFSQVNLKLSQAFENPNFRFRRHSSQSSLNLPLNLQINNNSSSTNNLVSPLTLTGSFTNLTNNANPERVCSSPISNLKMSSRVCQIKIDEGIEPHLSREIKSERETQNTLKLKSSCDELMINNDDLGLESFGFDREQNRTNSPNFLNSSSSSSTFKRYRTFSESQNNQNNNNTNQNGNMPSPSISSCQSYSNSSSPTGFIVNNNNNNNNQANPGLLRCFSPSTTLTNQNLNQSQLTQNYFSQSPSPTRKLFVTRRSMSPVPCSIRPSSFNPSSLVNNKRKISDVEQNDFNSSVSSSFHSPKRSLVEQEFVQPLLICTGNNPNLTRALNRSATSSPSPSLGNQTPLSPSTTQFQNDKNLAAVKLKKMEEDANKYTFVPIQLPPPASSPGPVQTTIFQQPSNQIQNKRLSILTNNPAPVQLNNQITDNSPTNYLCDSPISCSPSVSLNVSNSMNGDKPDSGYQSSAQNNSDSESCT